VEFACAHGACFGLAFWASRTLAAFFDVEVRRADPDSAARVRTVDAVAGMVFVVFLIESDFEFEIEEIFHV
jgi:hypothetical protein